MPLKNLVADDDYKNCAVPFFGSLFGYQALNPKLWHLARYGQCPNAEFVSINGGFMIVSGGRLRGVVGFWV